MNELAFRKAEQLRLMDVSSGKGPCDDVAWLLRGRRFIPGCIISIRTHNRKLCSFTRIPLIASVYNWYPLLIEGKGRMIHNVHCCLRRGLDRHMLLRAHKWSVGCASQRSPSGSAAKPPIFTAASEKQEICLGHQFEGQKGEAVIKFFIT